MTGVDTPRNDETGALALPFTKARYYRLAESGRLTARELEALAAVAGQHAPWRSPDARSWLRFSQIHLLSIGVVLVAVGVVFFFAANWSALPGIARMALLAVSMCLTALFSLRLGLESAAGRALIAMSGLLVGPLLAVYGQTYQTGADSFELFFGWALLLIPFAFLARWAGTWVFVLVLLELSLGLYLGQVHGMSVWARNSFAQGALGLVNIAGFIATELYLRRHHARIGARGHAQWLARIFLIAAMFFTLPWVFKSIADRGLLEGVLKVPVDVAVTALGMLAGWLFARRAPKDLFVIAGVGLVGVLLSAAEAGYFIHEVLAVRNGVGVALTGVFTLATTFIVGVWVRRHMRTMNDLDDVDERDRYADAEGATAQGGAR